MIKKFLLCLTVMFSFIFYVNAECMNEELNEWATTAEGKFTEVKQLGTSASKFAYLLSVTPERDDIKIKVTDGRGKSAEGQKYQYELGGKEILAVGCKTNLEEETYTIEVYGNEDSACPNQLLKTIKYTVPRLNRYYKDSRCKDSDLEICQTFTNSTEKMTEAEFNNELKKAIEKEESETFKSRIIEIVKDYGLYILIPLVLVSIIYAIKINKYKKEERDR